MKSEMVKLEHKGLKFKMSRPRLAEIALASVFVQAYRWHLRLRCHVPKFKKGQGVQDTRRQAESRHVFGRVAGPKKAAA